MNEREAFLDGIIANPNDDVRRLVFADWLEEHGEESRAFYIREQIKGIYGPGYGMSVFDYPNARYFCTKENYQEEQEYCYHEPYILFQRGFIERITWSLNLWLEHGPKICREHPILEVRITDKQPARQVVFDGHGFVWCWYCQKDKHSWCSFDLDLANYLTGTKRILFKDPLTIVVDYQSLETAYSDLSKACILLARSPLTPLLQPTERHIPLNLATPSH